MNIQKILGYLLFFICPFTITAKSITINENYYSKNKSIEFCDSDNKLKLTLFDEKLYLSSLDIEIDKFLFKKGKLVNTKYLKSGMSTDVYVSYIYNNFELYSTIIGQSDNEVTVDGVRYVSEALKVDVMSFENHMTKKPVYIKSYFNSIENLKDTHKGLIYVVQYDTDDIKIRSEAADTAYGYFYSNSLTLGSKHFDVFFEMQNLSYRYQAGLELKLYGSSIKIKDFIYPQSVFSGRASRREYQSNSTIYKKINKELFLGYEIKDMRVKIDEKVTFNENLERKRTQSLYATVYFIKDDRYNLNVKFGMLKEKPIIEIKIENLKIGYKYSGFYSALELKFLNDKTALKINYECKKTLDLKISYYF